MEETKQERFKRIAELRMNNYVLKGMRLLSNLKSGNYASTPQMRRAIIFTIRHALDELEANYAGEKINKEVFKFSSDAELEEEGE